MWGWGGQPKFSNLGGGGGQPKFSNMGGGVNRNLREISRFGKVILTCMGFPPKKNLTWEWGSTEKFLTWVGVVNRKISNMCGGESPEIF